mgnify:CR=1 FL=1
MILENQKFSIRSFEQQDSGAITDWAKTEGFIPGLGDIGIYSNTDNQGIWLGCIGQKPIGSIAGIKYNKSYAFIGLFIVLKEYRGNGYGVALWQHALNYLDGVECIGLEAAPSRIKDYSKWGFNLSSKTTRWQLDNNFDLLPTGFYNEPLYDLEVVDGRALPGKAVEIYDAQREASPRPHFLSDWLSHPLGKVSTVLDPNGMCHGFGRIRPCLLKDGEAWRIGPLLADTPPIAEMLLRNLLNKHNGKIFLDTPGLNPYAPFLLESLGFESISNTFRMYKGLQPPVQMNQIYGLACLELG